MQYRSFYGVNVIPASTSWFVIPASTSRFAQQDRDLFGWALKIEGEGKDIVLMHGWGCQHQHMQSISDHLSKHYRVTNVDLPGRGLSDWSEEIKCIDDIADCILPVLPEKAIYIGNSIGGPISFSIAARFPGRVEKIIGVATSPKFMACDGWPAFPQPGFKPMLESLDVEDVKTYCNNIHDEELAQFDPKPEAYYQAIDIIEKGKDMRMDVFAKGLGLADQDDARVAFQNLACPVELILGEDDFAVPKAIIPHIQALRPKARIYVVPGAQHMLFWTHPKEFFALLDETLQP